MLHVVIVTAQRTVFEGASEMVNAPGSEGQLGILPRHAPLLTTLGVGELRVRHGGVDEGFFVGGGFLEVNRNVVTVLADDAERAANIDEAHAQEARRRAQALLQERPAGFDEAAVLAQLELASGRLHVAELHRRRGSRTRPPGVEEPGG
jgi:F-type H+-transporting ATPase subunit epsilon